MPEIDGVDDLVEVGRGGFGVVYRGVEARYGRNVAVKLLTANFDEHAAARFNRELRAMGAVTGHPNIVTVFRDGQTAEGQPYLVMEFLPGGSMEDQLRAEGPLDWRAAALVGAKLADALESAHAVGIVHRDVKPDNVFRTATGEPKLGDFGIARLDGGFETRTGQITASLAHAPPEVLEGERPDVRSDIYSLASTIYTMVAGHSPFETDDGVSIATLIGKIATQPVPELALTDPAAGAFRTLLRVALSKVPGERPPTAGRFGELLRRSAEAAPKPDAASGGAPPTVPHASPTALPTQQPEPAASAPPTHQPAPAVAIPSSHHPQPPSADPERSRLPLIAAGLLLAGALAAGAVFFLTRGSNGSDDEGLLVLAAGTVQPDAFVVTASVAGDPADADLTPLTLPEVSGAIDTVRGEAPGLYAASLTTEPCDRTGLVDGLERDLDRSRAWAVAVATTSANIADRIDSYASAYLKAEVLVEITGFDAAASAARSRPALLAPGTSVLVDDFGVPRVRCLDGSPINPPSGVPPALEPGRSVISIVPGARMTQLDVDDIDAPGGALVPVGPNRASSDQAGDDAAVEADDLGPASSVEGGAEPLPTVEFGSRERVRLEPGPVTIRLGDDLMSFVLAESHEVLSQEGHLLIYFDGTDAEVDVFRPFATNLRFELSTVDDVVTYLESDSRFGDLTELDGRQFNGYPTRVFQGSPESFLAFMTTPRVAENVGWVAPPLLRLWLVDAPNGPVIVTAESVDEDLVQFDETTAVALEVLGSMNFRSG